MNSKQKRLAVQKPYDEVAAIMAYEAGEMNEEQIIELFQHLVNNGHAWQLQGAYGREAAHLIKAGLIRET